MAVFMGKLIKICSSGIMDYTELLDYTKHSYSVPCLGRATDLIVYTSNLL